MSNTKVISFINFKGGVGKSTVTYNIGAALEQMGKKVLLIDFDGQGNLTSFSGVNTSKGTLIDILNDIMGIKEYSVDDSEKIYAHFNPIVNIYGQLYILPCDITKEKWVNDSFSMMARETILKRFTDEIKDDSSFDIDYILIDNAPSVNVDLHNALVASDYYSIITEPEKASTDGINIIGDVIDLVKNYFNANLESLGVIINKVDERTNLHNGMKNMIKNSFGNYGVLETVIPKSIIAGESEVANVPICKYKPQSKINNAFHNLAEEILGKIEK